MARGVSAPDADLLALAAAAFPGGAPARFGIAVSGGGDSMALLVLMQRCFPGRVLAATVDHGLRAESAAEAATVAGFCARHGIAHRTLRWQGPKPAGNLMEQARRARLALLAAWALAEGIGHVLLGHTADDQAETFVMNLGRAAGLDGLSGMRRDWHEGAIHWHRPLLQATRARLRDYLRAEGVTWVDDPSNENDRFARVRARKALKVLAPLGISVERLNTTIQALATARASLTQSLAAFVSTQVRERAGALELSLASCLALPPEMRRRLLLGMIGWMGGAEHAPREAQIARLEAGLQAGREATLAGLRCRLRGDTLLVARELRAVEGAVAAGGGPGAVWDHRWRIRGPAGAGLTVAALGADGLRQCPDWRDHGPREALLATPAIWDGPRLIAAPLAQPFGGFSADYRAELMQGLADFILSH